jgi:hypothetical protein
VPAILCAEEQPSPVLTALTSTTISGYVDTSAQWNVGTGNQYTPTYSYGGPGKADGFNLNVVKLTVENPINPEDQWAAGYKVDLFMGPDANTLASQSSGTSADFALKQAYVAMRAPVGNGIDFKLGVWDTIIGYESTESPNNPNATRSYGYTIEPTTHTGLLGSYQFTDYLSASLGVANTFGPTINGRAFYDKAESYKTYMGSLSLTAPDSWGFLAGSTLSGGVINGYNGSFGADQTSTYVGATIATPVTGLKVGASYDYLNVDDQPLSDAAWANAFAAYVSFQATEKLTFYGRGEYATSSLGLYGAGDDTDKVFALTGTVQYDLWKNVLSRLEIRWDHAADGSTPYGGTDDEFGGDLKNSVIVMANLIYKF